MFAVYEVFKTDGKAFKVFEHNDHYECECWVYIHRYDFRQVMNGNAELVIRGKE